MDASERLAIALAIAHAEGDPLAFDVRLCAFAAAARRPTLCRPAPPAPLRADAGVLDRLRGLSVDELLAAAAATGDDDGGGGGGDDLLRLLQWLLLRQPSVARVTLSTSTPAAAHEALRAGGAALPHDLLQQLAGCRCVLLAHDRGGGGDGDGDGADAKWRRRRRLLSYHGTRFAALHSVLHHGVLVASGTALQAVGAAHGAGVYSSTDFATALSFAADAAEGWRHSRVGTYLRAVLLLEVDADAARAAAEAAEASGEPLPRAYVLAPRPADVRCVGLLVLCDDALRGAAFAGGGAALLQQRRRHPGAAACLGLVAFYAAAVLAAAAWGVWQQHQQQQVAGGL